MGVRCWDDRYAYVVLSGSRADPQVIIAKHVTLPVSVKRPELLATFRQDIYDLLTNYRVANVCYKCHEPIAKTKSVKRGELEGVLQETCFSHAPSVAITGRTFNQLKSVLHFDSKANLVAQMAHEAPFLKLAKTNFDEAVVAALSLLPE